MNVVLTSQSPGHLEDKILALNLEEIDLGDKIIPKRTTREERYCPHFTRYASFTKKRNKMYHII